MTNQKNKSLIYIKNNWQLYLLSLPGLIYVIGYKILPLFGLQLAFKDFNMFIGNGVLDSMIKSPWVGLDHFKRIFKSPEFTNLLSNTVIISLMKIALLFPIPIIFALMINEMTHKIYKRSVQTIIYIPHFLSWVIVHGIFITLIGANGVISKAFDDINLSLPSFYTDPQAFRWLLVLTEGWKEIGWSSIIYIAALTTIDQELYDAAYIDGASYLQRIWHVTLPGILPIISLMFMLRAGNILEAGFGQIIVMYNPAVYQTADVLQTYIYRIGLGKLDFSTGTAIGIFESLVGFVLLVSLNQVNKKFFERSLW